MLAPHSHNTAALRGFLSVSVRSPETTEAPRGLSCGLESLTARNHAVTAGSAVCRGWRGVGGGSQSQSRQSTTRCPLGQWRQHRQDSGCRSVHPACLSGVCPGSRAAAPRPLRGHGGGSVSLLAGWQRDAAPAGGKVWFVYENSQRRKSGDCKTNPPSTNHSPGLTFRMWVSQSEGALHKSRVAIGCWCIIFSCCWGLWCLVTKYSYSSTVLKYTVKVLVINLINWTVDWKQNILIYHLVCDISQTNHFLKTNWLIMKVIVGALNICSFYTSFSKLIFAHKDISKYITCTYTLLHISKYFWQCLNS